AVSSNDRRIDPARRRGSSLVHLDDEEGPGLLRLRGHGVTHERDRRGVSGHGIRSASDLPRPAEQVRAELLGVTAGDGLPGRDAEDGAHGRAVVADIRELLSDLHGGAYRAQGIVLMAP